MMIQPEGGLLGLRCCVSLGKTHKIGGERPNEGFCNFWTIIKKKLQTMKARIFNSVSGMCHVLMLNGNIPEEKAATLPFCLEARDPIS